MVRPSKRSEHVREHTHPRSNREPHTAQSAELTQVTEKAHNGLNAKKSSTRSVAE